MYNIERILRVKNTTKDRHQIIIVTELVTWKCGRKTSVWRHIKFHLHYTDDSKWPAPSVCTILCRKENFMPFSEFHHFTLYGQRILRFTARFLLLPAIFAGRTCPSRDPARIIQGTWGLVTSHVRSVDQNEEELRRSSVCQTKDWVCRVIKPIPRSIVEHPEMLKCP